MSKLHLSFTLFGFILIAFPAAAADMPWEIADSPLRPAPPSDLWQRYNATPHRNRQPAVAQTAAQPIKIFENGNGGGVANGGRSPQVTLNRSVLVTYIMTYHWNDGRGHRPGTIGLVSTSGAMYGPWRAGGQPGQGGVPDAYWIANPNVVLPAGMYQVIDSDPASWAQNQESRALGMTEIRGVPQ